MDFEEYYNRAFAELEDVRVEIEQLTEENARLRAALEEIKLRSVSLADAQVTALEALKG